MLPPDRFLEVAEEGGAIDALTAFVLGRGLDDAGRWQDARLPLSIAINVSMENLGRLDFPDWVSEAAVTAGVSADSLVLEITESRLMRDRKAVLDILTRLRLKHVGLSIDDFGTGYASLAQLRDIPFDELKIDQSFVHDAHSDASLRAILEASLGMAEQLGITSVAEGVENIEDWTFLRRQNCDVAQGYFIGEPMPVSALGAWLSDWAERSPSLLVTA
jgi:EAL domain-containing protein (putative c-di-GMP-specific phosphodiesterase class I)